MLMKEIKLEGIIYKIKLVNQLTMIFHKVNLAKQSVDLIQCGPILSFNLAPPDLNFWLRHCVQVVMSKFHFQSSNLACSVLNKKLLNFYSCMPRPSLFSQHDRWFGIKLSIFFAKNVLFSEIISYFETLSDVTGIAIF